MDGYISEYAANLIAENLYSQTDPDGNEFLLLNEILDHISTDKEVNIEYAFEGDPTKLRYKKITAGWELLVEWDDKTHPQSWIYLKDLKESWYIGAAEFFLVGSIYSQEAHQYDIQSQV